MHTYCLLCLLNILFLNLTVSFAPAALWVSGTCCGRVSGAGGRSRLTAGVVTQLLPVFFPPVLVFICFSSTSSASETLLFLVTLSWKWSVDGSWRRLRGLRGSIHLLQHRLIDAAAMRRNHACVCVSECYCGDVGHLRPTPSTKA